MNKLICLIFYCLFPVFGFAGGGEYEFGDDSGEAGPAYFGFVRDQRGSNIRAATVTMQTKNGPKIEIKSNILGVYRSHYNKTAKPEEVSIRCEKPGYKFQKILVRKVEGTRYQEADCLMQKT